MQKEERKSGNRRKQRAWKKETEGVNVKSRGAEKEREMFNIGMGCLWGEWRKQVEDENGGLVRLGLIKIIIATWKR